MGSWYLYDVASEFVHNLRTEVAKNDGSLHRQVRALRSQVLKRSTSQLGPTRWSLLEIVAVKLVDAWEYKVFVNSVVKNP